MVTTEGGGCPCRGPSTVASKGPRSGDRTRSYAGWRLVAGRRLSIVDAVAGPSREHLPPQERAGHRNLVRLQGLRQHRPSLAVRRPPRPLLQHGDLAGKPLDRLVTAEDGGSPAAASTVTGLSEAMPAASASGRHGARLLAGASTPSMTRKAFSSSGLAGHPPGGRAISARRRILALPSEEADARRCVNTRGPSPGGAPHRLGRIHGR